MDKLEKLENKSTLVRYVIAIHLPLNHVEVAQRGVQVAVQPHLEITPILAQHQVLYRTSQRDAEQLEAHSYL